MISGVEVVLLDRYSDDRGWLLKVLMRDQIPGDVAFGEIYVTVAEPGAIKGQHYHRECTEWFCVVAGQARLLLVDVASGERQMISMGEGNMVRVRIPPLVAHGIQNTGQQPACLVAYADQPYDYDRPDTIPMSLNFDLS